MEIQVKKLRDALSLVVPIVPSKTTLPVTKYVRLGEGRVVATDLAVMAAFRLPEANEDLLLPGKEAMDFLKYALGAAIADITVDGNKVTIAAGGTETSFSGIPSVWDFPPMPKVDGESQGVVNGDRLVPVLVSLVPCASTEGTRPVLCGINLTPGEKVEAAAADGFRLAWKVIPTKLTGPSMIIPQDGVKILEHLWKKAATPDLSNVKTMADTARAPRLIRMNWGGKHLKLSFDSIDLIITLTPGSFPNYRQLIPTTELTPVIVDAEDMWRALSQIAPVAKEGTGIVRLQWDSIGRPIGEELMVSAKTAEQEVNTAIAAEVTDPGRTAAHIRYLKEYFKEKSGPVSFKTESHSTPILFTYRGVDDFVVMPMFVDQGDKAKAKAEAEAPVDETAAAEGSAEIDAAIEASAEISEEELEAKIVEEEAAAEEPIKPAKKKEKVKK